jgi:catechol 2,3-dioxygenase
MDASAARYAESTGMTTTARSESPQEVLAPGTVLDHVHLTVNDLDREIEFYEGVLRLKVHRREGDFAALGAGRHDLLRLTQRPDATRPQRAAGMYHFSLLVTQRVDLARWLRRITETQTPVEGLVHHAPAAEAIYLPDPEGNTVELNWDPPREVWSRPGQPPFRGNLPLDTDGLFKLLEGQPEDWVGPPPDTTLSHIHLYVGDLDAAERFYVGVIGFERTTAFPGQAVFTSAGGYHHHVAFNVWAGKGIPPQPEGALGLRHYAIRLTGKDELDRVLVRVRRAGLPLHDVPEGVLVRDPAGMAVILTMA